MKKLLLIYTCAALSLPCLGQQFIPSDTLNVENSQEMTIRWTDWSGDQSPDLLVLTRNADSIHVLLFNREMDNWLPERLQINPAQTIFELADMDNDGLLDFIGISENEGARTLFIAYQIADEFEYRSLTPMDSLISLSIHDINHDGKKDILASGIQDGKMVNELIVMSAEKSPEILPFAPDSTFNYMISGNFTTLDKQEVYLGGTNGIYSGLFSEDDFILSRVSKEPVQSLISADLFSDAMDELLFVSGDAPEKIRWFGPNGDSTLISATSPASLYSADFTSDGLPDIWVWQENGYAQMWSRDNDTQYAAVWSLPFEGSAYAFGDQENDGDLDLAVVSRQNKELIHLFTNSADTNRGPSLVPYHVAFGLDDTVHIYWAESEDDHTSSNQLTYDLIIGKSSTDATYQSGAFDLEEARRMSWIPGNMGLQNESFIRQLSDGIYYYGIQSLDNSRFPVVPEGPGTCEYPLPIATGAVEVGGSFPSVTKLPFCNQDSISLSALNISGWFSAKNGFLGMSREVRFKAIQGDTIYQKPVSFNTCDIQPVSPTVFILEESENVSTSTSIYACEGDKQILSVFPGGDSTRWTSGSVRGIGQGILFEHLLTQNDTLVAQTYFNGCIKTDSFYIHISKPDILVDPESAVVFKGNSIQLQATGASTFEWSPPSYLDTPFSDKPISIPDSSIVYSVIGRDSLGCADTTTVRIDVQDQAFIPNLFTPNGDNTNDRLLIYGMSSVKSFKLYIYNRNGALVYSTTNATEVTVSGWDGTKNGEPQPDGVYYWKVEGTFDNNDPVLLNGKNEGVIHLMR